MPVNKKKNNKKTDKQIKLSIKFFTGVGSIVIFLSWVSQNFIQEKWHSEIVKLERSKMAIALNEINKNIYQTFLNSELSKSDADSTYEPSLLLAYSAYDQYANMLQHIGTKIASDEKDFIDLNDSIFKGNLEDLQLWIKNKDITRLAWFAGQLSKWEGENGMNTVWTYQAKLAEIRKKEDFWNNIYLVLYLLSACSLAYAFILDFRLIKQSE